MNTPEKLIKKGARMGTSVGLLISSIVSPLDPPKEVKAESNLQEQNSLTLLHGDGGRNRLNVLLVPQNGTTLQMMQEVKDDLFSISPMDEFRDKFNVYMLQTVEDLNCIQTDAICDWPTIDRVINRVLTTGITPHETMVVIKSNDEGGVMEDPLFLVI